MKTPNAFLARVGIYDLHRDSTALRYVLSLKGVEVGTFDTALLATSHGIDLMASAHKARKGQPERVA